MSQKIVTIKAPYRQDRLSLSLYTITLKMNYSVWHTTFQYRFLVTLVCNLLCITISSYSDASEQPRQVKKPELDLNFAQIILLKATNKNASGQDANVHTIREIVSKRMEEMGYDIQTDSNLDFDVLVKLDYKEHMAQARQTNHSSDSSCLKYAEAIKVMKRLDCSEQRERSSSKAEAFLKENDFPL